MNVLFQSAFLKALGWALLDSFWQMAILWLVYVLLTRNGKRFTSGQKHSLALLSLAGGAVWFIITLVVHLNNEVDGLALDTPTQAIGSLTSVSEVYNFLEPLLPFLSLAYLLSVVYLFIRLYRQYYFTQKLFSTGIYKVRPELRMFLQDISARMGIRKNVRIWLSELVDTPLTIGFWKPVILLPVAVINHLSIQQAEAIILHELNHIRRNDYFVNLLIACMDILLFFNPFVRILTHIIKNERENSCDDMVLQFRYDAGQYANALLMLEKNRIQTRTLTMNATGRSKKLLLNRVERILNKRSRNTTINQKLFAYMLSAVLIAMIGFYNPGKVILTTIDSVQKDMPAVITEQQNFNTPVAGKEQVDKVSIVEKRTSKTGNPVRNEQDDVEKEIPATELIDWVSTAAIEELVQPEPAQQLVAFAGSDAEMRNYSIAESVTPEKPAFIVDVHPYVPSTSFSYHIVEDTALPKKYLLTQSDVKAKEAMTTALKALQELDWQKLEKEMTASGKKIDIIKLQEELKKAISNVDWKKINEEMQSSQMQVENDLLKEHSNLQSELKKFQRERSVKVAEHQKIYQAIIEERLCEDKIKETKPEKKKVVQKKKIVYI